MTNGKARFSITAAVLVSVGCLALPHRPAHAQTRVKVKPPICETTVVTSVSHGCSKADSMGKSNDPDDAWSCAGALSSGISYANGKGQVGGYANVPAMENSRIGDRVRLCLVSFLTGCPAGDDRGREYTATNLRTHNRWKKFDASHMCGGA
jgi:hypothetical protein